VPRHDDVRRRDRRADREADHRQGARAGDQLPRRGRSLQRRADRGGRRPFDQGRPPPLGRRHQVRPPHDRRAQRGRAVAQVDLPGRRRQPAPPRHRVHRRALFPQVGLSPRRSTSRCARSAT
jgi:hypothetical protein